MEGEQCKEEENQTRDRRRRNIKRKRRRRKMNRLRNKRIGWWKEYRRENRSSDGQERLACRQRRCRRPRQTPGEGTKADGN